MQPIDVFYVLADDNAHIPPLAVAKGKSGPIISRMHSNGRSSGLLILGSMHVARCLLVTVL